MTGRKRKVSKVIASSRSPMAPRVVVHGDDDGDYAGMEGGTALPWSPAALLSPGHAEVQFQLGPLHRPSAAFATEESLNFATIKRRSFSRGRQRWDSKHGQFMRGCFPLVDEFLSSILRPQAVGRDLERTKI